MKRIILITGVSSGFGRVTSQALAGQGHIVYGTSRSEHTSIKGVNVLSANVNQPQEIENAVQTIVSREGRIDVLINNAGFGLAGAIEDFSAHESALELSTNFYGVHHCCQAVLPFMRKQGAGTIITVGSIAGLMGIPFQGFYSASKFAVEGYMQALRYEVRTFGVNIVMINPGDFNTGFTANRQKVAGTEHSHYKQRFLSTLKIIETDESGGLKPEVLSRKISKIVLLKNPRHRYVVASFEQKLAVTLSKILPSKWFFKIIAGHYKV